MLNIVIPMAGSSEEFSKAGYLYSKPLIEIKGKPLIQYVLENLEKIEVPKRFVFIVNDEDCQKFHLDNTLKLLSENCIIIKLTNATKGALCSVLMAIDEINNNEELLILNSDQVLDVDLNIPITYFRNQDADSGIITFNSVHPRWSYARIQEAKVVQTAEKNPISKNAIAGFYYFKEASQFFQASFRTILFQDHLDGQFFISSVINQFVLSNKRNLFYKIDSEKYHSFYSVQKVKEFESFVNK